jgi:hypothetical protein
MMTMIITAFGLVAALFWQDAIKQLIAELVPQGQGLFYSFLAALLVTVLAVVVIWLITKYMAVSARIKERVRERVKGGMKTAHPK